MELQGGSCILWTGGGKEVCARPFCSLQTQGPAFSFHPGEETAKECLCVYVNYCNVLTPEISMKGVQQGYRHFDIHVCLFVCVPGFPLLVRLKQNKDTKPVM
ncbi:hypothetical protein QQF64_003594 [Cirrhinus molitorella]|uniref:Uncharacterized protein n=1 Tax=Cirrhinus molitorella TaxID=172907 RepID=A0ABR3MLT6_9TELE